MSVQQLQSKKATINAELFNAVARHFVNFGDFVTFQFKSGDLTLTAGEWNDSDSLKGYLKASIPQKDFDESIESSHKVTIDSWTGLYKSLTAIDNDTVSLSISDDSLSINDREVELMDVENEVETAQLNYASSVELLHGNTLREWLKTDPDGENVRIALTDIPREWNQYKLSFQNTDEENVDRVEVNSSNSVFAPKEENPIGDVSFERIGAVKNYVEVDVEALSVINYTKMKFLKNMFDKTLKRHSEYSTYTFKMEPRYPTTIERNFSDIFNDSIGATIEAVFIPTKMD